METQTDITGHLRPIIPADEIRIMVERLAKEIRTEYHSKTPVILCVLKGAVVFTADLIRAVKLPLEMDFVQMSSYAGSVTPSNEPVMTRDASLNLGNRHVLIVDAIIDSGVTMSALCGHIRQKGAASVKVCALLSRDKDHFAGRSKIDFIGTRVGKGFIVGYGLDYKEHFRNLPGLYMLDKI